ncbi:MAG: hypothetical protein IPJ27_08475 [Candidatus Accumulibacter sp.]|uniref:Uncharacterized protein n=1 Tax=Candidatus Accumulibacter proximus TaxID=2954385 RepID=A0A935PYF1_9PROT|nr:hypothetical protein [Candidatus Accumulibacter proximus]
MPAAQVILGRVELRGSRANVARGRASLLAALDSAPWPQVGADRLVFIRRLSLRGTPHDIAWRAAAATRQLAERSINGWLPAADEAPAVHFASRAARRACLLVDLLAGRAGERWFWRRERRLTTLPIGQAMAQVLTEEPLLAAEIIAIVERTPFAETFWRRLDNAAAGRVAAGIGSAGGWVLPVASLAPGDLAPTPALRQAVAQAPASWRCLAGRDAAEASLQLAALLLAWQRFPALLGTPQGGRGLAVLAQLIAGTEQPYGSGGAAATPRATAGDDSPAASRHAAPGKSVAPPIVGPGVARIGPQAVGAQPAMADVPVRPAEAAASAAPSPGDDVTRRPTVASSPSPAAPGAAATPRTPAVRREQLSGDSPLDAAAAVEDSFLTTRGGLFYLLNFLALASVQTRLNERSLPACGWRWLARLGYRLGLTPDPPLGRFLAAEIGVDDESDLATLPPLPDETALLHAGLARYGALFGEAERFSLAARVVVTCSHVDVHFRLADVSLPVRRAGLDVNPGWLPWLGRVVSFHYGRRRQPPPGFPP